MEISKGNVQRRKLEQLISKIFINGDDHTLVNRLTSLIRIVSHAYKDRIEQLEPYFTDQNLIGQYPFIAGFARYMNLKLCSDLVEVCINQQLGDITEPERTRKFQEYEVSLYIKFAILFHKEQNEFGMPNLAYYVGVPLPYCNDN